MRGSCVCPRAIRQATLLKRDVIRDAFQRIARMGLPETVTVSPSPESGYRMRARLHGRAGRIGFVRDGTHDICDPARTEQLMETTLRALSSVETWLKGTSESRLQAIELAESIRGDQRVLHVEADRCPRGVDTAAMESSGITGISWSVSGMRDTHILLGSPYVADPLEAVVAGCDVACAKVPLRRHVRGFFQANRHLLRDLVTTVVRHADGEGPVVDLYSGVGLYAVGLASVTRRAVVAVEGDRWSIADLETNAAALERPISVRGIPVEDFLVAAPVDEDATVVLTPREPGCHPVRDEKSHGCVRRESCMCHAMWRRWRVMFGPCSTAATSHATSRPSTCSRTRPTSRQWSSWPGPTPDDHGPWAALTSALNSSRNSPLRQKFSGCH